MDPITHGLLGLVLSLTGLNRLTSHASWVMVLGALLPDIDRALPFEWQRSMTHSWLFVPVLGFWAVAIIRILFRKPANWIGGWIVGSAAVSSHLLLDCLTVSGLAWLWPFTERITHFDLLQQGDPWIAALLLIAVIAPFLSRMVSSEIGAKQSGGRAAAIFALILVCFYVGGRTQLQTQAKSTLRARIYDGEVARRVAAIPHPHNPFSWTGLIETQKSMRVVPVSALGSFDPDEGLTIYPPEPSQALDAALRSSEYVRLQRFITWPHWQIIPADESTEISVEDLRTGLALKMVFDEKLREIVEKRTLRYPGS